MKISARFPDSDADLDILILNFVIIYCIICRLTQCTGRNLHSSIQYISCMWDTDKMFKQVIARYLHAWTINEPHLPYKTGLDVMQSHPLRRTRFGQYQACMQIGHNYKLRELEDACRLTTDDYKLRELTIYFASHTLSAKGVACESYLIHR